VGLCSGGASGCGAARARGLRRFARRGPRRVRWASVAREHERRCPGGRRQCRDGDRRPRRRGRVHHLGRQLRPARQERGTGCLRLVVEDRRERARQHRRPDRRQRSPARRRRLPRLRGDLAGRPFRRLRRARRRIRLVERQRLLPGLASRPPAGDDDAGERRQRGPAGRRRRQRRRRRAGDAARADARR
jgi:hypothetical protein